MSGDQLYCTSFVFIGALSLLVASLSLQLTIIIIFILFQLLNSSYLNPQVLPFFPVLLPAHQGESRDWVSGCVGLNYWLVLNHDRRSQKYVLPHQIISYKSSLIFHWHSQLPLTKCCIHLVCVCRSESNCKNFLWAIMEIIKVQGNAPRKWTFMTYHIYLLI